MEYLKSPRKIGAIAPSRKNLSEKMIEPIDFNNASVIVEYGSGTGSFTEKIISNCKNETTILLIEQNENFCKILSLKYFIYFI